MAKIAKLIEKHTIKKKVTLLIHDWGSFYGYLLSRERPDLVSRIASIDIGALGDRSKTSALFGMSYQLLFCLLFALGDPLSTWFLKLFFILNPVKKTMGHPPRPMNQLTGSMMFPYYQIFFRHMFNPKDEYLKAVKEE